MINTELLIQEHPFISLHKATELIEANGDSMENFIMEYDEHDFYLTSSVLEWLGY